MCICEQVISLVELHSNKLAMRTQWQLYTCCLHKVSDVVGHLEKDMNTYIQNIFLAKILDSWEKIIRQNINTIYHACIIFLCEWILSKSLNIIFIKWIWYYILYSTSTYKINILNIHTSIISHLKMEEAIFTSWQFFLMITIKVNEHNKFAIIYSN